MYRMLWSIDNSFVRDKIAYEGCVFYEAAICSHYLYQGGVDMEEIGRLEFKGLSRAEIIDLKRQMPEGLVEIHERELGDDEIGVLDPLTASVIITLGLAGLSVLGAWLLKNRKKQVIKYEIASPGVRKDLTLKISDSMADADVVAALTKGIAALQK